MKKGLSLLLICLVVLCRANNAKTREMPPPGFINIRALVNRVEIHYVTGGHGDLLVLLPGFGENQYIRNRLLPELSKHFTVLATGLRGISESGRPTEAYSKINMAEDTHELVKLLFPLNNRRKSKYPVYTAPLQYSVS